MSEPKTVDIDIEYVARLARLELSPEEKDIFGRQLSDILDYIHKLNKLDTGNVEPTAHVLDIKNVLREDSVREFENKKEALNNAPSLKENLFNVPLIIE